MKIIVMIFTCNINILNNIKRLILFQMHVLMNFIDSTVTFFIFYFVKKFFNTKIDKILIKIDIYHKKIS